MYSHWSSLGKSLFTNDIFKYSRSILKLSSETTAIHGRRIFMTNLEETAMFPVNVALLKLIYYFTIIAVTMRDN